MLSRSRKSKLGRTSGTSAGPYADTARQYLRQHWAGPLWLPPKSKEAPPEGFTGRGRPYPVAAQVNQWIEARGHGNICLRMGTVTIDGELCDVVGIDIDDYTDADKRKDGGAQLVALESLHGPLPPTWRSTSRDGVSGIRFFLAPAGHRYIGKAAAAIDIISPGYRYAVVWPSMHPERRRYRWLDDRHGGTPVDGVPDPRTLPRLPDAWFAFLTSGRTLDEGRPEDTASTTDEILDWARDALPGFESAPCPVMAAAVEHWLSEIAADPSSHDKIMGAHWHLLNSAAEGHSGWPAAIAEVETVWATDVLARGKRSSSEVRREIGRSKVKALRKLKATVDQHAATLGVDYIAGECPCTAGEIATQALAQRNIPESVTRTLADVTRTKVEWLWRPWIPLGKVSILEGEPDVGKSVLTLTLAAFVSTGRAFPASVVDGEHIRQRRGTPRGVVLVGIEDDESDTIVPRLDAARADRAQVRTMRQPVDGKGRPRPFVIPGDVDRLRRAIAEADARLVVIDPITAYLSTKDVKAGDDPSTRQALMPLVELARDTGCAIVLVRHLNKAQGMSAKNRGSGTVAYGGLSRSVIVAAKIRDPEPDGATHAIALTKGNLSKDPASMGYRLDSAANDPDSPVVRWCGTVELNADQLVGADGAKTSDARANAPTRDECAQILRELLADGPMRADDAIEKTRAAVGCSAKPVKDAAAVIDIVKKQVRIDGKISHWTWTLPDTKLRISKTVIGQSK